MTFDEWCIKASEKIVKALRLQDWLWKWHPSDQFRELGKDFLEDVVQPAITLFGCIALVALPLAIIATPFYYYSQSCKWRWEDSKYDYKLDIPGGCKVKTIDGRWVPENNVAINVPAQKLTNIELDASTERERLEQEARRRGFKQINGVWVK